MDERQQVTIIARAIQTLEWLRDNPGSLRDETSIGSCMAAESWRELRALEAALAAQFGIRLGTIDHGQHEFPERRGDVLARKTAWEAGRPIDVRPRPHSLAVVTMTDEAARLLDA